MEDRREYQQKRKSQLADEFIDSNIIPRYTSYEGVSKFKSLRRAIRRGHIDLYTGTPFPKRPFSNRRPTSGREFNELKKSIYGQYKQRPV